MEKYKKIAVDIIEKIENKTFQIGYKLPTESQLTKQYAASRHTVRSALDYLQTLGYIHSRRGSGSYVSNDKSYRSLDMFGMSTIHKGHVENIVLDYKVIPCTGEWEKTFELPKGNQLIQFTRLRKKDGVPTLLEKTTIPEYLFPNITKSDVEGSFYHYVEEVCHYKISHGLKELFAVGLAEEEAKMLESEEGTPVIVIFNKGYLNSGEIFESSINIHKDQSFKHYSRRL